MGNYLDAVNNDRADGKRRVPNENYAREIMQLFSIGLVELNDDGTPLLDATGNPIPTYDQDDIKEFARVFTGWTYATRRRPAGDREEERGVLRRADGARSRRTATTGHDPNAKTLLDGIGACRPDQTARQDLRRGRAQRVHASRTRRRSSASSSSSGWSPAIRRRHTCSASRRCSRTTAQACAATCRRWCARSCSTPKRAAPTKTRQLRLAARAGAGGDVAAARAVGHHRRQRPRRPRPATSASARTSRRRCSTTSRRTRPSPCTARTWSSPSSRSTTATPRSARQPRLHAGLQRRAARTRTSTARSGTRLNIAAIRSRLRRRPGGDRQPGEHAC